MRIFRLIGLLVILAVVWVIGGLLWSLVAPVSSRMDEYAASRIHRECGWSANCKIKAGDLFEGKWDTVFVFAAGTTQQQLDLILGRGNVAAGPTERIVVLENEHHILRAERAAESTGKPIDGEIKFEDDEHRPQQIVRYDRDQWLRVIGFPIEPSGRFFVLTATDGH